MKTIAGDRTSKRVVDDPKNEAFNTVLREAAEKREVRLRLNSIEEAAAAKQESADLLALALDGSRASSHPYSPIRKGSGK